MYVYYVEIGKHYSFNIVIVGSLIDFSLSHVNDIVIANLKEIQMERKRFFEN